MSPLYTDPDTGQLISTHSMLKTFNRCPKQTEFKYVQRLKPKVLGKPLRWGTWMHKLFEAHYGDQDWKEMHRHLTAQYSDLFDEEKEMLGDLPRDCYRMMQSYLWYYAEDPWIIHEVEFVLDVTLPDGSIYRCKIDLLVENQFGLWIVDHKNHKKLPDLTFRLLDYQSALYIWAALKNKLNVMGHIWNYLRSRPPTIPKLVGGEKAPRLSQSKIETDYPTMVKAIKAYGLDHRPYRETLKRLKAQRYRPGEMQTSPFFRRDVMEKSPELLRRVAQSSFHTHKRMHSYPFDRPELVERVVDRSCTFMCNYTDLCTLELFGGDTRNLRRSRYSVGDPLDYYQDDRMEEKGAV